MSFPGVGAYSPTGYQVSKSPQLQRTPEQEFLDFMKLTPAQRMQEQWLAAHGLTRQDLENMEPEKRDALMKQMAQEIEEKIKQQALNKNDDKKDGVDILA